MNEAGPPAGDFLSELRATLGDKGVVVEAGDMEPFLREWRGRFTDLKARCVALPHSSAQVAAVVKLCAKHRVPIVPQGGNTSLVASGVPFGGGDELILSLARMNRIRAVDPLNHTITVEAGCVLQTVQEAAAKVDRLFPLSLGAEGTCQIGGNLSTNAGGVNVLRYGNAREQVLGLEVVLPDGRVWDGLRALRKDNTGYDLKHLFIGAEGTLGIITAAVLKLYPLPRDVHTAFVALRDPAAAIELLARARGASGDRCTSFELIPRLTVDLVLRHVPGTTDPLDAPHDWYALIELSGPDADGDTGAVLESLLERAFEDGLVVDATIAQSAAQAAALWRIRETVSEGEAAAGASLKHDVAVPVSQVPAFIAAATPEIETALPGVRVMAFGHVGDGNVHFNLIQPEGMDRQAFYAEWPRLSTLVHDRVTAMSGSISAEHGIGHLKRDALPHYKSAVELDLMRTLKAALDPAGLMNPGKVL
jgi:FAD/FMN-containing dehydrogenase